MGKKLLLVSALAELPVAAGLLLSPALVVSLLLGTSLEAPVGLVVGRVAGAALLSLGAACWVAHSDGDGRAVRGMVVAMLLYNAAAAAVLTHAGAGVHLVGVLLWPAVALHAALGLWCIACLPGEPATAVTVR